MLNKEGIIMTQDDMLRILKFIKEPLAELTAFCDGVTCEYVTAKGHGGFELLDWSDLDVFDFDVVDEVWDCMKEKELKEWVGRYNSGTFSPVSIILSDLAGKKSTILCPYKEVKSE